MQKSASHSQAYDEKSRRRLRDLSFKLPVLADPLAAPRPSGQGEPSLTLVAKAAVDGFINGDADAGTGRPPEPPDAKCIYRVLIAPHICWRVDAMGDASGIA